MPIVKTSSKGQVVIPKEIRKKLGIIPGKKVLLQIKVIIPSSEIIFSASEIKAKYAISYADCFAAATALKHEASIITGDPEFKKLENIVKIEWV